MVGSPCQFSRCVNLTSPCNICSHPQPKAPTLGKFLQNPSPGVVAAAAYVLAHLGPMAAEFVPALEAALGNESEAWSKKNTDHGESCHETV